MITPMSFTNYQNAFKFNTLQNRQNTSKPVSFGELDDDFGDCYYPNRSDERQRIEDKYSERLTNLAKHADDIGMSNFAYYEERRRIEIERDIELLGL